MGDKSLPGVRAEPLEQKLSFFIFCLRYQYINCTVSVNCIKFFFFSRQKQFLVYPHMYGSHEYVFIKIKLRFRQMFTQKTFCAINSAYLKIIQTATYLKFNGGIIDNT